MLECILHQRFFSSSQRFLFDLSQEIHSILSTVAEFGSIFKALERLFEELPPSMKRIIPSDADLQRHLSNLPPLPPTPESPVSETNSLPPPPPESSNLTPPAVLEFHHIADEVMSMLERLQRIARVKQSQLIKAGESVHSLCRDRDWCVCV